MNKLLVVFVACAVVAVFGQEPPPPPFLQGASPAVIQSFNALLQNAGGKTDKQIDDAVDKWVAGQSAQVKSAYVKFKADIKQQQAAAENAHKAALAKFSPAAKAADAKLSAIANSPALTAEQKGEQIQQILGSLPANVRNEIESAMQG
ncbi:hypothetical protein QR680_001010 [Steinernema hermaphroditum]|uniref:SXP/RAL-2 family protein Ani s 5-like cation-binding domain-containing protein n=1 Tax=Steinernema hermaphroditum TaxID=289476 RepID=A0AA39LF38_9BILA|nr:hypothetical protein QR680_001010 [Steinernema hermaphroditum]